MENSSRQRQRKNNGSTFDIVIVGKINERKNRMTIQEWTSQKYLIIDVWILKYAVYVLSEFLFGSRDRIFALYVKITNGHSIEYWTLIIKQFNLCKAVIGL